MKKEKILYFSKMFMFGFVGYTMASAGINLKMWQCWVLIALVTGISVVSLHQGRSETKSKQ
jgi:hypothetical protein